MTDDQSRLARKLTSYLDRGAAAMRPGTLYRLQRARAAALANIGRARETQTGLVAAAAGGPAAPTGTRPRPVRWLGAVLVVAILGFGYQQWHAMQQVSEFEDLDLHLLASDLPIDAYLDRGFQNWLRNTFDY